MSSVRMPIWPTSRPDDQDFPFARQIQLATDFAKGAVARLAGQEPPKYEDSETTLEQLQARIGRTLEFLQGIGPGQLEGAETREISLKIRDTVQKYAGLPYLVHIALPNFFFHAATAYDLLRHHGVELGQRDFVGTV